MWKLRRIRRGCRGGGTEIVTASLRGGGDTVRGEALSAATARPSTRRRRGFLPPRAFPWWSAHVESRVKMADDLGDDWWENQPAGAASSPGTHSATLLRGLIHPPPPLPPLARPQALPRASSGARLGQSPVQSRCGAHSWGSARAQPRRCVLRETY